MSITIECLGHAGFVIEGGGTRLAIDPFLTGNPQAKKTADQIECDAIAVTHGHADHASDVPSIAKRTGATVFGAFEVCDWLQEQGHEQLEPMNPGGRIVTPFGWVAFTQAFHSSSYEGRYMGQPMGVVVNIGGRTVYHLGDTALFSDMRLIGAVGLDMAVLPIGDNYTMGPDDALEAVKLLQPKVVVPSHYNTWPVIEQGS